ncbi:hypothetical protein ANN_13853 [Periplaneta americana]|uniref:Uncharacterized protein n=1 Tax=Periplaneta americana TaxID=6978 RepID=A0ABQ8SVP4_PERAM|nr:hypothetical protein ANN_13853 [Periplaneta americana]
MRLLRPLAGYTLYDHKRNADIRAELIITAITDTIESYRNNWGLTFWCAVLSQGPTRVCPYGFYKCSEAFKSARARWSWNNLESVKSARARWTWNNLEPVTVRPCETMICDNGSNFGSDSFTLLLVITFQRILNLTGPMDNNDVTLQQNRNKTAGRIDGCYGNCISCCLCYASKILRNFRTSISFKEKRA